MMRETEGAGGPAGPAATGHAAGPAATWEQAGEPLAGHAGPPPVQHGGGDARTVALLAHLSFLSGVLVGPLSILGPVLAWLLPARKDPFAVAHAKEALNFQITVFGIAFVAVAIGIVVAIATLGIGIFIVFPLLVLLGVALTVFAVVFSIVAAVRANQGHPYRYPVCIRLF